MEQSKPTRWGARNARRDVYSDERAKDLAADLIDDGVPFRVTFHRWRGGEGVEGHYVRFQVAAVDAAKLQGAASLTPEE